MNGLWRRAFFAFAATLALFVAPLVPCRAQTKTTKASVRPPDVPVAFWVPDRFERAIDYQFPNQTFLMTTVINDVTGESKHVCIEGQIFFFGVCLEHHLTALKGVEAEPDEEVRAKVVSLILGNRARVFHFKNAEAWRCVQPRYTPEMLAKAQEQFGTVSTEEIARRFDEAHSTSETQIADLLTSAHVADDADGEAFAYFNALVRVFTERGLYMGRHFAFGRPYVIPWGELAKRDEEKRKWDAQDRQEKATTERLARSLRAYNDVTQQFFVTYAIETTHAAKTVLSPYLSFNLKPKKPGLIDLVHWYDPITRTGKPHYDWKQFIEVSGHVERMTRQHPWLKTWKDGNSLRTIDVWIFGRNPSANFSTKAETNLLPVWQAAGLKSKPYCMVRLTQDESCVVGGATLYLPVPGSGETRSLIVQSEGLYAKYSPPHTGDHFLERLNVRSDAKAPVRQCVVVTPSGEWKLVNLPPQAPPIP